MKSEVGIWESHDKGKSTPLKTSRNGDVKVENDEHDDLEELNEFWCVLRSEGDEIHNQIWNVQGKGQLR